MTQITLHPEFGLNPSMGVCFWCGKEDGTILMLGRNKGKEAPRHVIGTMEPCATCKTNMATGITLMEATFDNDEPKPTGRWVVMKEEAARRVFVGEVAEQMMKMRKAFLSPETAKAMGLFEVAPEREV